MVSRMVVGPLAQSGRAPPLQGGGHGFKSRRVHNDLGCFCLAAVVTLGCAVP